MKMNKYHDTLARTVAGLKGDGKDRHALYERARAALVRQIMARDPPLTKTEIMRERLALEEAICLVEAETTRRQQDSAAPVVPIGRPPARGAYRRPETPPLRRRASSL